MKLLTKEILNHFKQKRENDYKDELDPIIVCKFFNPTGAWTWFASEYNEEEKVFFGYVSIFWDHCDEWGYFSLVELESFRWPWGLGIERDLHFTPTYFSKIKDNINLA